jgi:hypothetical protein
VTGDGTEVTSAVMADFFKNYGTYAALAFTLLIAFLNWRTAEAGKKSPINDLLADAIRNNKEFANRIGDRMDQFFKELIPRLMLQRDDDQ